MSADVRVADEHWIDDASGDRPPFRRLLIMAGVAAVLAVAVGATVLPGLAPPVPTRTGEPLVEIDPKKVRVIEITPREGPSYAFLRNEQGWELIRQGGSMMVPDDRLDGFLTTLAGLTRLVEIGDDVDPTEFGLAPPRARVALRNGEEVTLALGDRNPPLTGLYVQVLPSSKIVLVGAVLLWEFDKLAALARTQPVEP